MTTQQKESLPGADTTAGFEQKSHQADIVADKRFATLAANAALAGQRLTKTSGGYMLSRWGYSKHCADLDTVTSLLRVMGVKE